MNHPHPSLTRRLFLRLFFPTLLMQLFNAFSTLLDFIIPGQFFGELALSAIALTTPLLMLLTAFADMISLSGSALFSRELGRGNPEGARRYFTASMLGALLLGGAIAGAGLLLLNPLTRLLGADDTVFEAARKVTAGTLVAIPVVGAYLAAGFFVRNDGHPRLAMAADIVFTVVNLGLDILFTGFTPLGVVGSIAASIAAAVISTGMLCAVFFMKGSNLRFTRAARLSDFADVVRGGYGLTFQSVYEGVAAGVFNNAIMRAAGADGLVLYSVVTYANEILRAVSYSVRDTVQPMLSSYVGENRPDAMRRTMAEALRSGALLSGATLALLLLLPAGAYRVFGIAKLPLLEGASALARLYAPVAPALCFTNVMIGYYQFLELPRLSFVMLLIQQLALKLPAGLLGLKLGGVRGMTLALVAAEYLTALLCALLARFHAARQSPPVSPLLLLPAEAPRRFLEERFARKGEVMAALDALRGYLDSEGVPAATANRVVLALEELGMNICAYNGPTGVVELCVQVRPGDVAAQVRDTCKPFDPVEFYDKHPRATGYGLALARHVAADLEYVPTVGLNRTMLRFDIRE